ncbi:hypothetical protein [Shinella pollutisoli]|uniref:Uncharacterized protein n=1 Tax=Shinella pollutisoli TaxID=2250594 RepID=A0ABV7DMR2_9HYPH|nr:hypothetical protein [Shinella pollutisoli]
MIIRQADLARELDVSEMTVHRLLKALHRNGRPLTDLDATTVFASAELQALELSGPVAIDLLAEMSSEIRYVAGDQRRRCWIVFVETERQSFRVAAISARHLESILDAHPLSLVLPLHEVVARAAERLDALRAKKSKEAA